MTACVLVLEDDPTLMRTIERNLDVLGYEVRTAATVEEPITVLRHELPALLLLDIALPDGCGWDVLRELHPTVRERLPVIVMSVLSLDAQVVESQRATCVLQKPFPIETLLRLVTELLGYPPGMGRRFQPTWILAH